jgi:hypothetical protein
MMNALTTYPVPMQRNEESTVSTVGNGKIMFLPVPTLNSTNFTGMVEVFKTNVNDPQQARMLLDRIRREFTGYEASFDLEDCDKILRVECCSGTICCTSLISFFKELGYVAEPLCDETGAN